MNKLFLTLSLSLVVQHAMGSTGFDDFASAITGTNTQKFEDALALLPKEMRSNFTLMHESRSAQAADYLNPRTILFSEDGKFFATFNGSPSQRGYERLEMMQYREEEKEFEFRFITFEDGKSPVVSPANPAQCLACHGQRPRPIWEDYFTGWAGAYGGETDDSLSRTEATKYLKFRNLTALHPRYSKLEFQSSSRFFPYLNGYYPDERDRDVSLRPNTRLGMHLGRHLARQIFENLRRSPLYDKYKALFLYYSLDVLNQTGNGSNSMDHYYRFSKDEMTRINAHLRSDLRAKGVTEKSINEMLDEDPTLAVYVAMAGPDEIQTPNFQKVPWLLQYNSPATTLEYIGGEVLTDLKRSAPALTKHMYLRSLYKEATKPNYGYYDYFRNALKLTQVLDQSGSKALFDPKASEQTLPLQKAIRDALDL
jgi:hypothetical protein